MNDLSEYGVTLTDKFAFFLKGPLSQWWRRKFTFDGVEYNCAEQAMMAAKAKLFGDTKTLEKIMATKEPREQKDFGRDVTPYDDAKWDAVREETIYRISVAKFSQHSDLQKILLETGDRELVEVNPRDKIWGIGLAVDDPRAQNKETWQGRNLLGIALTRARETLWEDIRRRSEV